MRRRERVNRPLVRRLLSFERTDRAVHIARSPTGQESDRARRQTLAYLLHQLLTESAMRWPDKEAVRFDGQALTYAQLDRVTNQLAREFPSKGVCRGDRVGIYVHKSLASVISVFGILKAGGV